jgi:hypothetical protein
MQTIMFQMTIFELAKCIELCSNREFKLLFISLCNDYVWEGFRI